MTATVKIKHHTTAGCFLVRKNDNRVWEIALIYKKWIHNPNPHGESIENKQGWVPPKGHVEKDESLEEAAIRETTEETGYKNITIIQPLQTLHIEYPWNDGLLHKKDIHYFLAKLINEECIDQKLSAKEKNSIVKVEWLTLKQAEKELLFDDEREILKQVIEILKRA